MLTEQIEQALIESATAIVVAPGMNYNLNAAAEKFLLERFNTWTKKPPDSCQQPIPLWWQPNSHGEMPGGLCCQRAAGKYCYDHDYTNYVLVDGKYQLKAKSANG